MNRNKAKRWGKPQGNPKPRPPEEEEVITLEDLKRAELDSVAEKLGLSPDDYSNKAKISEAIRAAAEEQEQDINDLIELE